jgi:biopolymer transport protein ExbD
MNFRNTRKEDPEINLIPMIDVLLVIIIFLMLTTTYSRFAELQINLPTAEAEKQLERENEISIVMSSGGQYQVNRRAVSFRDVPSFSEELRRAGAQMKEPVVVINADSNVTHQAVVRVMDAARQAGYGQIAFAVEQAAR